MVWQREPTSEGNWGSSPLRNSRRVCVAQLRAAPPAGEEVGYWSSHSHSPQPRAAPGQPSVTLAFLVCMHTGWVQAPGRTVTGASRGSQQWAQGWRVPRASLGAMTALATLAPWWTHYRCTQYFSNTLMMLCIFSPYGMKEPHLSRVGRELRSNPTQASHFTDEEAGLENWNRLPKPALLSLPSDEGIPELMGGTVDTIMPITDKESSTPNTLLSQNFELAGSFCRGSSFVDVA